jgi:hypothetical protein
MTALDSGWSIEGVANRLMVLSAKVREEGNRYALRTTGAAAAAVK